MNIVRTIAKSIPVLVIALLIIEIIWSNTLVTSGREVSSIDLAIANIRQENEQLAQQVASASAIATIGAEATSMGFVAPKSNQFVMIGSESLPVALNRPQ